MPKNWKFIGGLSLGSTGFDFYLGADTVVPVRGTDFNGAVNAAFKNFRAYGGAKKEGDWKLASYRVWYIFPENDAGFKVVGFWSDLPEWKWEDHKPEGYSASVGEEDALAAVEVNLEPLETVVTEAQNNADESAGAETVQEELPEQFCGKCRCGAYTGGNTENCCGGSRAAGCRCGKRTVRTG